MLPLIHYNCQTFKEENGGKPQLKTDKTQGMIIIDEMTTLSGIPKKAWEYVLGNRTALKWVLEVAVVHLEIY